MPAHNEQTKFSEDLIVSDDQERDCHRIERDQYSLTKSKKGYHQYEVMKTPMDDRDSPRQASKYSLLKTTLWELLQSPVVAVTVAHSDREASLAMYRR